MAKFPNRNLNQTAVYWGNPQKDGYGGFTWDDPIEIDCRWIDNTELVRSNEGKEIVSTAQIQVSRDLDKDGMIYLGTLNDLDSDQESDPLSINTAFPIIRFEKIPTMDGSKFFRKVYL